MEIGSLINKSQPRLSNKNVRLNTLQSQLIPKTPRKRSYSFRVLAKPSLFTYNQKIEPDSKETDTAVQSKEALLKNGKNLRQLPPLTTISPYTHLSKQYETKLLTSAEKWFVYSYETKSYKRGWKPSQVAQFTGFMRLLIFKVYAILAQCNPEVKEFKVRINNIFLKEEIYIEKMKKNKKISPEKRAVTLIQYAINRILQNNMIISMIDLIYGLLLTNYDDLVEYAVVHVGYFCYCHLNNIDISQINSQHPYQYITKISEANLYTQYFQKFVMQHLFPSLNLHSSQLNAANLTLSSTLNNICSLYLSIESLPLFQQIAQFSEYESKVKYQVGYNFWETRSILWKNQRPNLGPKQNVVSKSNLQNFIQPKNNINCYGFVANWKGVKNYTSIAVNKELNILIILQQCKFGMLERDVRVVENWVRDMKKPIVEERKLGSLGSQNTKLASLLKLTQQSSFPKIDKSQLKRANTEI